MTGALALLIMLPVSINYVNSLSSLPEERASEVRLLKALGAEGSIINFQFLAGGLMCSLMALLPAFLLAEIFLPYISQPEIYHLSYLINRRGFILYILVVSILSGAGAGIFSAIYFSRFSHGLTSKTQALFGLKNGLLRKALVVVQFSFAACLLIFTLRLQQQTGLPEARSGKLNTEILWNLITSSHPEKRGQGKITERNDDEKWQVKKQVEIFKVKIPGSEILQKSFFSSSIFRSVVSISKVFSFSEKDGICESKERKNTLTPDISLPKNGEKALADIDGPWKEGSPKKNHFLQQLRIMKLFTLVALFTACFGLSGFATYSAGKRRKETGIRKLMGAPASEIVLWFLRGYAKLIFIAVGIAVPSAYVVMRFWIPAYSSGGSPGADICLISGIIVLLLSLLSVLYQSIKTAMESPVKNLQEED